jgi:uncharacterized membrane protein (UPF0127 family)
MNFRIYFFTFFLVLQFTLQAASCAAESKPQKELERHILNITIEDGTHIEIDAEYAVTDSEKEKGLMFRKELPDGRGMLFVYPGDQTLSFWMKNTILPLSIAFIKADGTIADIFDMEPLSLRPIVSTRSVRYALEVPRGWFTKNNITVGDIVRDLR